MLGHPADNGDKARREGLVAVREGGSSIGSADSMTHISKSVWGDVARTSDK